MSISQFGLVPTLRYSLRGLDGTSSARSVDRFTTWVLPLVLRRCCLYHTVGGSRSGMQTFDSLSTHYTPLSPQVMPIPEAIANS